MIRRNTWCLLVIVWYLILELKPGPARFLVCAQVEELKALYWAFLFNLYETFEKRQITIDSEKRKLYSMSSDVFR